MSVLPIAASILLALVGYLFAYFHKRASDQKAARLERINRQLRDFYGPLYAHLMAGQAVWTAFSEKYWPKHGEAGYFGDGLVTTDAEKATWRLWMIEVFGPLNERIQQIILHNLDLSDEADMPEAYVDAVAHAAGYKALARRWADGDFADHTSLRAAPTARLLAIVQPAYRALRNKQRQLLGLPVAENKRTDE